MARFVSLVNWTDQGVREVKSTAERAKAAQEVAQKLGGSVEVYWTVGPYDMVAMSEFPDDESGTAFFMQLGVLGNVRTSTMRAYDSTEIQPIIARMS